MRRFSRGIWLGIFPTAAATTPTTKQPRPKQPWHPTPPLPPTASTPSNAARWEIDFLTASVAATPCRQHPLITSPETRERNMFGFGFRPLFRHGPPLLSLAPPASASALIGGYKYWDSSCLRGCSGSRHPRIVTATTKCLACSAVGFRSCRTA